METAIVERVTKADYDRAQRRIAECKVALERASAEYDRLAAPSRKLRDKADALDAEAARLEAERVVLLPRLADGSREVDEQLRVIAAKIAQCQADAKNARQGSDMFAEQASQMSIPRQAAATALTEAEFQLPYLRHRQDCEDLESGLDALRAVIDRFLKSAPVFEEAHQQTFGTRPNGVDSPVARLARLLSVWSHEVVGPQAGNRLTVRYPAGNGSLTAPLERFRARE